ncbi:MAG: cytochrome c biogenesis protein ResB, partial [Planctomycetota bacterium]
SGDDLGTYLVSQLFSEQTMLTDEPGTRDYFDEIDVGKKTYRMGLRFAREAHEHWVKLKNVKRELYEGTSTPRDFSSFVKFRDIKENVEADERVWMNNPVRFGGYTYYQSQYRQTPDGREYSALQVVKNTGWLVPYVACSIIALGMLVHFLQTLNRDMGRQERLMARQADSGTDRQEKYGMLAPGMLGISLLVSLMYVVPWSSVYSQLRPSAREQSFDFASAGKIPVQFAGRVMPLESYARITLKEMSNKDILPLDKQTAPAAVQSRVGNRSKMSAVQWFFEAATDQEGFRDLDQVYIVSEDLLDLANMTKRKSHLFSLKEIDQLIPGLKKVRDGAPMDAIDQSFKEKKAILLSSRIMAARRTMDAMRKLEKPNITREQMQEIKGSPMSEVDAEIARVGMMINAADEIGKMRTLRVTPPTESSVRQKAGEQQWDVFTTAYFRQQKLPSLMGDNVAADELTGGLGNWIELLDSYESGDPSSFNTAVDNQMRTTRETSAYLKYSSSMVSLEQWMRSHSPSAAAMFLYIFAIGIGTLAMGLNSGPMRRGVLYTVAIALLLHTSAIVCRYWISGKMPVVNLYSAAIFIGWGAVVLCLLMEATSKRGVASLVACIAGFSSLLIADQLNTGDTMPVLQAVLDTQFWLGTHVLTITLGYTA